MAYGVRPPVSALCADAAPRARRAVSPRNERSHRPHGAVRRSREMAWLSIQAPVPASAYRGENTLTQEGDL